MEAFRCLPFLDRVVVTRPLAEARRWVEALSDAGWPAQTLPLISIGEPRSIETLKALGNARAHWQQWDAIMFVSSAAVAHFFASGCAPATQPNHTRFWAPGPATGRALALALRGLGLDGSYIDAPPADAIQFDSEALWPVVSGQLGAGMRVLVVRGGSRSVDAPVASQPLAGQGRDWLIQQCEAQGAQVCACVAYERHAPVWNASVRAQAVAAASPGSLWLLSSSESVSHLRTGLPEQSWAQAIALATHPRIAKAASVAGFGEVQAARPALTDVLRALESRWSPR